ncbi:hypothetical protein D3C80_1774350 [compost metagenome]
MAQAQAPGNRRTDLGELKVQLGIANGRLVGLDRAFVLAHQGSLGVQGLLGDTVFGKQAAVAFQVQLGILELGLVL